MVARKKNKKASPKKKRKPKSKKTPIEAKTYKIVNKNISDSLGAIKLTKDEFESYDEYLKFIESYRLDPDSSPQSYLSLIEKFKKSKDKKKLRFTDSELKTLEKALHSGYSFIGTRIELDYLKGQLAWANTAFTNKSNSYEKNLREFGGRLGLTKGAKKPRTDLPFNIAPKGKKIKFDPQNVTSHYKKLIASGVDRKEAVLKCIKKFPFASPNACSKYLRKQGLKNIPTFRNVR